MKKIYSILSLLCAAFVFASCAADKENAEEVGYLKLEMNTLVSTHTRVTSKPDDYDAKKMHVEIRNSAGVVVLETEDVANDANFKQNIVLVPGTYTIVAHSAGWDGSDSAMGAPYYAGMTTVNITAKVLKTASLTCTQANVKVTVNWDQSFRDNFKKAQVVVTSELEGVALRNFIMGTTVGSAYFPVAPLNLMVSVENNNGGKFYQENTITDVNARDHFIINYKVAEGGKMGGVTVFVDDATNTYTYNVEVPRKSSTALQANNANAWGNFAQLAGMVTAKTSDFDPTCVSMQWKLQSDANWTTIDNSLLTKNGDNFSYKLTNLSPSTAYQYRLNYKKGDIEVNSNEVKFTTDPMTAVTNGGFENWWKDGSVWYPNAQGGVHFWDSSNPGSASMGESYNVTTRTTDAHSGSYAARLGSTYVIIKFAAASLYTGSFDHLVGTKGAVLNWGQPFTARPTALKGWMKYTPGSINRGTQPSGIGAPVKGANDQCQVYCALLDGAVQIDNTQIEATFPKWDGSDSRVIAYGQLTKDTEDSDWAQFNIPLTYYSATRKPTHVLILCSSSKFGDYFYGSDSSVLLLDDFEFEYGTEPIIQ